MARFVVVHDLYETTHINVDHVVRVHAHPGGYTIHMVNSGKYELTAGSAAEGGDPPAYSWDEAAKVVDKITGYALDSAGNMKSDEAMPDDDLSALTGTDNKILNQILVRLQKLELHVETLDFEILRDLIADEVAIRDRRKGEDA